MIFVLCAFDVDDLAEAVFALAADTPRSTPRYGDWRLAGRPKAAAAAAAAAAVALRKMPAVSSLNFFRAAL